MKPDAYIITLPGRDVIYGAFYSESSAKNFASGVGGKAIVTPVFFAPPEGGLEIPQRMAEHLYGSTQEIGGKCHVCKEFRALVDAKWPADRSLPQKEMP